MDAQTIWRRKTDDEVLAAYRQIGDFTDEGQQILSAEVERRSLSVSAPDVSIEPPMDAPSDPLPGSALGRLWAGRYSLPLTYWGWGIGGMILWRMGLRAVTPMVPAAFALAASLLLLLAVITYSVVVGVGLWRSANRYTGRPVWAVLAKVVVAANASTWVMQIIYLLFGPR